MSFLLGNAHAVVINHEIDISSYRELASADPFSAVVQIEVEGAFGTRRGSGVVIADQWVITAAHVTEGADMSSVRVNHSGLISDAIELRYASGWDASPAPGLTQGADLVLVRLGSPTGLSTTHIAPSVSPGQVGFLGGFGRSGNGVLGASGPAELLFAMNVIDRRIPASGGGFLVTDFDDGSVSRNSLDASTSRRTYYDVGFDSPTLSSSVLEHGSGMSDAAWDSLPNAADFLPGLKATFLEGSSSPGDSGGPIFVFDESTGDWQLAGLSSWGINPLLPDGFARTDSRYGDLAFFTDLTTHRNWILETVPEPRLSGYLGFLMVLLLTNRKRKD